MTDQPGTIALVGSGEFLPAMAGVDTELLVGRSPRVAVIPTAAGLESPARVRYWFDLAHQHYQRLGAEVVEIAALNPDNAADPAWAQAVQGCGLIYLSGGNPHHLATTLAATALWAAIVDAWKNGAALAGCSAGAMALAQTVAPLRGNQALAGLNVVQGVCVLPHFDRYFGSQPLPKAPPGTVVIGIDEETALVGGGGQWRVHGRGVVTVFGGDTPQVHGAGNSLSL